MKPGLVDRLIASVKVLGREEHLRKVLLDEISTNTSRADMEKWGLRERFLEPKSTDSKGNKVAAGFVPREYIRSVRESYRLHRFVVRLSRQELRMVQSRIKKFEAQIAWTIQQLDNRPRSDLLPGSSRLWIWC